MTRRSPRATEPAAAGARRRVGRGRAAGCSGATRSRRLEIGADDAPGQACHVVLSAGHGVRRPRAGLGRRDPPRRASAATPSSSSRTRRAAPSGPSSCSPTTTSSRCRSNAPRTRTPRPVLVGTGHLSRGFRLPDAGLQLWAETDVFEEERKVHERRRSAARTFLSDFRDLKVGDLVVHVDHGIGVFVGLKRIEVGLEPQEFMELRYAGEDKLFVPVERLDLVQRYTGAARPALDRLGGTTWEKAKTRVKKAMRDMAEELLKLYAARKADARSRVQSRLALAAGVRGRVRVGPDAGSADRDRRHQGATWRRRRPMDRLLCGDVGYGKTEVAMRAAFKAVMDGKQVAFLAPTTVLAFQHLKTLKNRFAAFPVRIDMVSRFRTQGRAEGDARGPRRRQGRDHRRHAPPAVEGRAVPRPRPARRGRGTAVRRRAQGEDQAAPQARRRPDDDRDADSAHAEHVARGHPRHVDHRDPAEGSAVDPDQRREVRPGGDLARDPHRDGARRPDLLRPQPRGVDLLARQPDHAAGARGARWPSRTGRWARTSSSA